FTSIYRPADQVKLNLLFFFENKNTITSLITIFSSLNILKTQQLNHNIRLFASLLIYVLKNNAHKEFIMLCLSQNPIMYQGS
ncbi:hypothetical protein ACJX0J_034854, partial [Zea mays]